ncbi:MAG: hypothetical protein IV100_25380 [Myxococcales bacterium]|nr:hypothetical protein [Myxococcales bacterium]
MTAIRDELAADLHLAYGYFNRRDFEPLVRCAQKWRRGAGLQELARDPEGRDSLARIADLGGQALYQLDMLDEAIQVFREAIELGMTRPNTYMLLASACGLAEDFDGCYEAGIAALEQAQTYNGDDILSFFDTLPSMLSSMANAADELGKVREAVALQARSLIMSAEDEGAANNLCFYLKKARDPEAGATAAQVLRGIKSGQVSAASARAQLRPIYDKYVSSSMKPLLTFRSFGGGPWTA